MKAMTAVMAASSLLIFGTLGAQQPGPPEEQQERTEGVPVSPHQEQALREIVGPFEELDEDGDGSISRQEAQAASELLSMLLSSWSTYDLNSDDRLDQQEFYAFRQSAVDTEAAADTGQSGRTQPAVPATRHQEEVLRGSLMERLDTDGDGQISRQEAQSEPSLTSSWDQIDRNRDGKLDSSELAQLEQ